MSPEEEKAAKDFGEAASVGFESFIPGHNRTDDAIRGGGAAAIGVSILGLIATAPISLPATLAIIGFGGLYGLVVGSNKRDEKS